MESSTSIAASPPLVKRHFCDLQYGTNMAASPDSVATARSITTADTVNSAALPPPMPLSGKKAQKSHKRLLSHAVARAQSRSAQRLNDSMVYLEGPAVYSCGECGTHLTTNDDIISKSFHGHHGRAFLLDTCVNVTIGPAEDRRLLTGLHSVCDILCKRCNTKVGWTYKRAYELSQKYKEGKFIVEKIFLSLEDDDDGGANTLFDCRRYGSSSWSNQETSWSRSYASMDSSISELSPRSSFASTEKMVYEY